MQTDYILPTQEDVDYFSAYAAELMETQPEDFDPLAFVDEQWEE